MHFLNKCRTTAKIDYSLVSYPLPGDCECLPTVREEEKESIANPRYFNSLYYLKKYGQCHSKRIRVFFNVIIEFLFGPLNF